MQNPRGIALVVGLKRVNPDSYGGWNGENGCWGCELDVDNMARILDAQGFEINMMKTESATRDNILDKIGDIAQSIDDDDIFVFYYSGHGGQQVDRNSDELDGHDETLIAYDREIIDDELYEKFRLFPAGTRLVMISDSCNSGTNYRSIRDVPFQHASPICPIPEKLTAREEVMFQMIHMGGCRDGGASYGYYGGGAFTTSLCEAWANGTFNGAYKDLFEKARKLMRSSQKPQYNEFGPITEVFRSQKPFTIAYRVISDEDRQTVWRAIEIIDRMDILPDSLESEMITAVRNALPPVSEEPLGPAGEGGPQTWLDDKEAMLIAQGEVDLMSSGSNGDWPMGAQVTKAFPVFIPGLTLPSYYECKVTDPKGLDTGYVLVNVDRTDLLIPEATNEGLTVTERYREHLRDRDFQVMRMDWIRSAAVKPGVTDVGGRDVKGAVLSTEGFYVDSDGGRRDAAPDELLRDFSKAYEESLCFPYYDRIALDEYYLELEDEIELAKTAGARVARGRTRTLSAALANTFSSSGWHTPAWRQFNKPNGYAIGCGNTAWAIVFGYFKQFHGKSRLFDGVNVDTSSMSETIRDCMRRCAVLCGTWDVADQGLTWPWKMTRGIGYAKEKGFSRSSCSRKRGTEYSKFDTVYNHLRGNKPGIILIHSDGVGVPNHYIVIEAGKKTQKRVLRKWRNRDVKYLCNFGWGRTRKWIYVRDWGVNQNRVYSAFSIFLPNVG
jgi:hypothetical protein